MCPYSVKWAEYNNTDFVHYLEYTYQSIPNKLISMCSYSVKWADSDTIEIISILLHTVKSESFGQEKKLEQNFTQGGPHEIFRGQKFPQGEYVKKLSKICSNFYSCPKLPDSTVPPFWIFDFYFVTLERSGSLNLNPLWYL